ncbi:hypothetical protein ATM97_22395 [Nocardia sp. MH4]|nr:hypothetical protein [Nocardia sp. MH4]
MRQPTTATATAAHSGHRLRNATGTSNATVNPKCAPPAPTSTPISAHTTPRTSAETPSASAVRCRIQTTTRSSTTRSP